MQVKQWGILTAIEVLLIGLAFGMTQGAGSLGPKDGLDLPPTDLERVKTGDEAPDFPFLSDPGHKVIDRYGLLNPNGRGLPHPATYVIDKRGVVRWKFVEVDYKIRPSNEQILEALNSLR